MSKILKYISDINTNCTTCVCPEEAYFEFEDKTCYRFVFEDLSHPYNFTPIAKIHPHRLLTDNCSVRCSLFGLSMFNDKENARKRFQEITKNTPKKFKEKIGTHIAEGIILNTYGQITSEGHLGHFELFEYENVNLSNNFKVIEAL